MAPRARLGNRCLARGCQLFADGVQHLGVAKGLGEHDGVAVADGPVERPAGIAIDRAGTRIFVADPPAHRIHIFRTKEA